MCVCIKDLSDSIVPQFEFVSTLLVFQDEKAQLLLTYLWMHYVKTFFIHHFKMTPHISVARAVTVILIACFLLFLYLLFMLLLLLKWWSNEFVSWDEDQCGTNKISLPRNKFWIPDIVINEL